jgi:hypothetical protein
MGGQFGSFGALMSSNIAESTSSGRFARTSIRRAQSADRISARSAWPMITRFGAPHI